MDAEHLRHREFESSEIAALLAVEPRRVEGWVETGLITPRRIGRGPGSRRRYTLTNVCEGAVLRLIQNVTGEKSTLPRAAVGAVQGIAAVAVEQLVRGRIEAHERNVVVFVIGWESGGSEITAYYPWDAEAAAAVRQARVDGDYVLLAPLGRLLGDVLERLAGG